MRIFIAIALLLTSLPISTRNRVRAASAFRPAGATHMSLPREDPSPSPSPTPTPDLVLEQAERDAKLAEELKKKAVSDQARAEAEAARLKALTQPFGAPANVSVPTGSVTTDAAGWVESQMLAQEAARQITVALTDSLCTGKITPGSGTNAQQIKKLVIHSPNELSGVELYGAIMAQLTRLKGDFVTKKDETANALAVTDPNAASAGTVDFDPTLPFAAPSIATGVIKSVAELINLFRTDTSFTNQAITLSESTIVSQVVNNLNSRTANGTNCNAIVRVYYPALYPPNLLDTSSTNSPLITLLDEVLTLKVEAAGNVEKLDARIKTLNDLSPLFKSRDDKQDEKADKEKDKAAKDKEIADKCKTGKKKDTPACAKLKKESKALGEAIAQLDKDIKKLDEQLKDVTADPKKFKDWIEKLTDLRAKTQALITATDLITAKLNTPDDTAKLTALAQLIRAERLHRVLNEEGSYTLHVEVKANGTTKVKKNLFVDAKVRHSAGADLTYQLIEGSGVIAQAQEMKCYIEYQSARNVQDLVSGTNTGRVSCKFQKNTNANGGNLAGRGANDRSGRTTANDQVPHKR